MPSRVAARRGSSTTVRRAVGGCVAPSSRVARRTASATASSGSRSVTPTADGRAAPDLGVVTLPGQRRSPERAGRAPGADDQSPAAGHRGLARGLAVRRRAHPDDARVRGPDGGLEVERHLHLGLGRCAGEVVTPQVQLRRDDTVRLHQTDELVRLGVTGVVPGLSQGVVQDLLVEGAGRGETLPVVADDPDADAEGLRRGERLDLTVVGLGRQGGARGPRRPPAPPLLRPGRRCPGPGRGGPSPAQYGGTAHTPPELRQLVRPSVTN